MDGFEWAENNLDVADPDELQSRGVNVYFAPEIAPDEKVIEMRDGRVDYFWTETQRPETGLYAQYQSLERYCREHELPLNEIEGYITTEPYGSQEAGDPLRRGSGDGSGG